MDELLKSGKKSVEDNDIDQLKAYLTDVKDYKDFDWPTMFKTLYLHACLKGRHEIAIWLQDDVFPTMDPIQKIALRQIFSYGQHLLKKHKT
jgi:hypothetical protein